MYICDIILTGLGLVELSPDIELHMMEAKPYLYIWSEVQECIKQHSGNVLILFCGIGK